APAAINARWKRSFPEKKSNIHAPFILGEYPSRPADFPLLFLNVVRPFGAIITLKNGFCTRSSLIQSRDAERSVHEHIHHF
ncbi:MAG TPA: hypothetical protein PLR47_08000, partial [Smithellaceae bacterium]|nr:hypothetical protein [Smithellaceae bacterium]